MLAPVCFVIVLLLLGIANILWNAKSVIDDKKSIDNFLNNLEILLSKYKKQENAPEEIHYFMAHGNEVSALMGEDYYNSPILTMMNQLRDGIMFTFEDEGRKVLLNEPSVATIYVKKLKSLLWQLANPFIWFYRGVEVISFVVLGYFINTGSITYRSKAWTVFNSLLSVVASIVTIISFYLQIK